MSAGSTRPSSHSLATPASSVGVGSVTSGAGATVVQKVRARGLRVVSAAPRMTGSSRTILLPRGADGSAAARVCARVKVAISGTVPVPASS